VQQVARVEGELLRLQDAPDSVRAAATAAAEQHRTLLLESQAALAALQERIAAAHPEQEGRAAPSAAVRATLAPDAAVVGWLDAEDPAGAVGRWGWVLRDSIPLRWFALPLPPRQSDPERSPEHRLRDALRARGGGALGTSAAAIPTAEARAVFEARVAPLLPALEGARRVIVVPSGGMLGVPVEALLDAGGAPLLERFAVEYAPSASLQLVPARQRVRSGGTSGAGHALLVGDPPFRPEHLEQLRDTTDAPSADAAPRAGAIDADVAPSTAARTSSHESLRRLPRLRWSRREIEAVATAFEAPRVLVGADASEQRVDALVRDGTLAQFGVLHFATHALADLQRPEDCALVLAQTDLPDPVDALGRGEPAFDGLITAREIVARWRLGADLVTLSACETALGRAVAGEGYLGLAHALLQAGSRCVLVSLWSVDDRATALLMEHFYRAVAVEARGSPRASLSAALRDAKLWLRSYEDPAGRRPFEHPRYWAGFVLVGAGG
jgi:CHAT domain-containing protein